MRSNQLPNANRRPLKAPLIVSLPIIVAVLTACSNFSGKSPNVATGVPLNGSPTNELGLPTDDIGEILSKTPTPLSSPTPAPTKTETPKVSPMDLFEFENETKWEAFETFEEFKVTTQAKGETNSGKKG